MLSMVRFKIAAVGLPASALAILGNGSVTAQVAGAATVVPDTLCDSCKDFTDAAPTTDCVRSAYRPGIGYATEPEHNVAFLLPPDKDEADLKLVEKKLGADQQ
jgi:hypothetical protein